MRLPTQTEINFFFAGLLPNMNLGHASKPTDSSASKPPTEETRDNNNGTLASNGEDKRDQAVTVTGGDKKRKASAKWWSTTWNNQGAISRSHPRKYDLTLACFASVTKKPVLTKLLLRTIDSLKKTGLTCPSKIKNNREVWGHKVGNTKWGYETFEKHVIARCALVFAYGAEWEPVNKQEAVLTWIRSNEHDMWMACLYFLCQVPDLPCHNFDLEDNEFGKSNKYNKFNEIMRCNTHTWKGGSVMTGQFMLKGVYSENYEGRLEAEHVKGAVYYNHLKAVDALWDLRDKYETAMTYAEDVWHISSKEKADLLEDHLTMKIWNLKKTMGGDVIEPENQTLV